MDYPVTTHHRDRGNSTAVKNRDSRLPYIIRMHETSWATTAYNWAAAGRLSWQQWRIVSHATVRPGALSATFDLDSERANEYARPERDDSSRPRCERVAATRERRGALCWNSCFRAIRFHAWREPGAIYRIFFRCHEFSPAAICLPCHPSQSSGFVHKCAMRRDAPNRREISSEREHTKFSIRFSRGLRRWEILEHLFEILSEKWNLFFFFREKTN